MDNSDEPSCVGRGGEVVVPPASNPQRGDGDQFQVRHAPGTAMLEVQVLGHNVRLMLNPHMWHSMQQLYWKPRR